MSTHRNNIPWRVVGWGMGLQLIIALLVFQTQLGQGLFEAANVAVTKLNEFANEGSKLVFGPLAERENMENVFGPGKGGCLSLRSRPRSFLSRHFHHCFTTGACYRGSSPASPG